MSAAVTTPRSWRSMRMVRGCSEWFLTTRLLTLRMRSVTSSTMPGIDDELVLDALDLDLGDRAAFQAGEQDPPQAVADGVAETALERFDGELAVRVGQCFAVTDNPAGQFEAAPTDTHDSFPQTKESCLTGPPQRLRSSMINCGVTGREISWVDGIRVTRPSGGSVATRSSQSGTGGAPCSRLTATSCSSGRDSSPEFDRRAHQVAGNVKLAAVDQDVAVATMTCRA